MNKIALIPAYQPAPVLLRLIRDIRQYNFEVILVNDGSSKEKENIFSNAGKDATVLSHPSNKGKGQALKTGLTYIQKSYAPDYIIVTVDADGQHKISDIIKVFQAAQKYPGNLILGSRKLQENVPLRSRFGNTVTRWVYRLTTGMKVHDTQTGLRAFSCDLIPAFLNIPGMRYEYEMNVLLTCSRNHIPLREIEIETVYFKNNANSHFDTVKDSWRIYREILKFSGVSFISFLIDYGLYSILTMFTGNLVVSNIGARVVSASINYTLNRKFVFQSSVRIRTSALRYFLLAIFVLLGNTIVLYFLADILNVNRYTSKLCTEILFFSISWLAQKFLIFRKGGGS